MAKPSTCSCLVSSRGDICCNDIVKVDYVAIIFNATSSVDAALFGDAVDDATSVGDAGDAAGDAADDATSVGDAVIVGGAAGDAGIIDDSDTCKLLV